MKKAATLFLAAALCLGLLAGCTDGGNVSQNPSGMIDGSETGPAAAPSETRRPTEPSGTAKETQLPSQGQAEHTEPDASAPSDGARGAARGGRGMSR